MSIYATKWEIQVRPRHFLDTEWVTVAAQAVPPHIGHPSEYSDGDPFAEFLPPVVEDYDPETGKASHDRAVVIVQEGHKQKDSQRYIDPLMTLSGEEYSKMTFDDLLERIHKAVGWDESVIAMYIAPNGEKRIMRKDC